jgi:hypothetical protein
VGEDGWLEGEGGQILFGQQTDEERAVIKESLKRSLERMPGILDSLGQERRQGIGLFSGHPPAAKRRATALPAAGQLPTGAA